jgi:hypothetical protein
METLQNQSTVILFRIMYILFLMIAAYEIIFKKDYVQAASQLGIALIFDPFNQQISWSNRPVWQRAWLIINLAITAALLGFGIGLND